VLRLDRGDRQSDSLLQHQHPFQRGILLHLSQGHREREFRHELEVHQHPARPLGTGFGVEVFRCRIELRGIRIRRATDPGDPDHAGWRGIGMVEQGEIAGLHRVAHEVPRLVVAHPVPGLAPHALEVVDREDVGLGFDQPVAHGRA